MGLESNTSKTCVYIERRHLKYYESVEVGNPSPTTSLLYSSMLSLYSNTILITLLIFIVISKQ